MMQSDEFLDRAMKKRLPPKEIFILLFVLSVIVGVCQHLTEPHDRTAEPPAVGTVDTTATPSEPPAD